MEGQGFEFRQTQEIFSSTDHPDMLWGPPTLLFNGYRVFLLEVKQLGCPVNRSFPSSADAKNEWSYTHSSLYAYVTWTGKLPILGAFAESRKATVRFFTSVRLYTWNNSVPTGRISMKSDIWGFFESIVMNDNFMYENFTFSNIFGLNFMDSSSALPHSKGS
jgi:hypothetical protein